MYRSEVKSSPLQFPASTAAAEPSQAYMTSAANATLPFTSSTLDFQQFPGGPDPSWLLPAQPPQLPPHHHSQRAWNPLHGGYVPQQRLAPTSPSPQKFRRSQAPTPTYKRGPTKVGFRSTREEGGEEGVRNGASAESGDANPSLDSSAGGNGTVAGTKRCRVCGDRAVNHNFGQLTCESCKAFFRRNAHKELTCTSKSGEHVVSPSTRRECPACRLKRCFLIGMRPDLIQVRKKDGTKPRWLDKYPAAAQVHEHHVAQSEASKLPHFQRNSSPGSLVKGRHRDPYPLQYPQYAESQHPGNNQLERRPFDLYTSEGYINPQAMGALPPTLPPPPLSLDTSLIYNGNAAVSRGEGGGAVCGDVDTTTSTAGAFHVKTELSSPQYRIPDCVFLTNPLADEAARHKGSGWVQSPDSIVAGVQSSAPSSSWLQPASTYNASHCHTNDVLLLDNFITDHTLLSNLQTQDRGAFGPIDVYPPVQHGESRSGASSGSTTSPSIASVPNFGSVNSDTAQAPFEPGAPKPLVSDWLPSEAESDRSYLQNLLPLRSKVFGTVPRELSQPLLSSMEADRWFARLVVAWRSAWRDGVFPNPSRINLHLDLDAAPEEWRLTLANLWSDLLLRRVASFGSSLFIFSQNSDLRLPGSLVCWIFQNRLVNCVPVILAHALLRPTDLSTAPPSASSTSSKKQQHQHQNDADDGGSSPRSPRDYEGSRGSSPTSPGTTKDASETSSVCFQVPPRQRVFISLSKLNAKLAEHFSGVYPMLQYLDAYICELNKFLTEQVLLLGVYMAIKLTEPPTTEELLQSPLSDEDIQQMNNLNVKFLQLFGLAADHVAASIVNGDLCDTLQSRAKAMNDAICRRTKLPDFLSWGRQFDDNIKSLLYDTWSLSRQCLGPEKPPISPCLSAFYGDTAQYLDLLMPAPTSDETLDVV
uniref:Nuclear receptor domain-containing protein n=1 Tax=Mesocestoides corti TaxID=53468 RepID=A0A5K3EZ65_MESCO